jgi:hypothetical protein
VDRFSELRVSMPEHLLDDDQGHLLAEKQCRGGVAKVVEPDRPNDWLGPETHLALRTATDGGLGSRLWRARVKSQLGERASDGKVQLEEEYLEDGSRKSGSPAPSSEERARLCRPES